MPLKRQTIRDHTAEANLFARRAVIALAIVAVLMGIVLSNLYNLQVNQFEDYQTRSNGNRIKLLPVAPNRGLILDRNGVILAENIPVFSLNVVPEDVDDLDAMITEVRQYIDVSNEQVEDFKRNIKRQRRFKPVALRTRLSHDEVARFSVHQHRFAGVSIEARLARHYPFGSALTHVVGYVAKINRNDLNKLEASGQAANYDATHDIGKLGIERCDEERLHGSV